MKWKSLIVFLLLALLFPPAARAASVGIWISPAELSAFPMSGPAWLRLKAAADGSLGTAQISDQNSDHDVLTLAVALVYARTGNAAYRAKAAGAILSAIGTERGGRTLALGRNLPGYVIAADLIDLQDYDIAADHQFKVWLRYALREPLSGLTLISTHERRANNWGTHAGAARIAADVYLGDTVDLEKAARVFKGWLGDRASYAGFKYGDLSWQASPSAPVGVDPLGSVKQGHDISGALPDDMRRGCSFRWPPCPTNYPWGALEGALIQAQLLSRAGYPAWGWEDRALLRAARFLYGIGWPAVGDDVWQPWLLNRAYGAGFPVVIDRPGKSMGWAAWTFGR
jgi:hypothetical protein